MLCSFILLLILVAILLKGNTSKVWCKINYMNSNSHEIRKHHFLMQYFGSFSDIKHSSCDWHRGHFRIIQCIYFSCAMLGNEYEKAISSICLFVVSSRQVIKAAIVCTKIHLTTLIPTFYLEWKKWPLSLMFNSKFQIL